MIETLSHTQTEDATAQTAAFLQQQRGVPLDGAYAAETIAASTKSVRGIASQLLNDIPHDRHPGLYVPLSSHNAQKFDEAVAVLPGYIVLAPSVLVERGTNTFYPAVVSPDSIAHQALRLHVLHQPFHRQLGYGASVALSAAAQSETELVGHHISGDQAVEAEHFTTLLTAGRNVHVAEAWRQGRHVNHAWRGQSDTGVLTRAHNILLPQSTKQSTITIGRDAITTNRAMLFWHEALRDEQGNPLTGDTPQALVTMQALGFEAVKFWGKPAVDTLKGLLDE